MKVVLIGGGGNIGLAGVVPALRAFGHEVTVVTRHEVRMPSVAQIAADYRAPGFKEIIQGGRFDAAISMITFTRQDAQILLGACKGVRQLVFISTVCVYGGPLQELPASETTPRVPITQYGVGKMAAEAVLTAQTEVPVTTFMPASTVGPAFPILRQLAVEPDSRWIRRVQQGKPIVVADDGLQLWSWCAAEDAGVPIAACLGRQECYNQSYILTRPDPISWVDYHRRVGEVLKTRVDLAFAPNDAVLSSGLPCGLLLEQSRWDQCYDTSKLRQHFPEFQPRISFEAMIEGCLLSLGDRPLDPNREELDQLEDDLTRAW